MSGKDWIKHDKQAEWSIKEKQRENARRYYEKHSTKVKNRVRSNYLKKREELYNELGGECKLCGQSEIELINFHHKVPMEVLENKIYHYIKNKDILEPFCIKCHVTWHNIMDWLKLDDVFKDE